MNRFTTWSIVVGVGDDCGLRNCGLRSEQRAMAPVATPARHPERAIARTAVNPPLAVRLRSWMPAGPQ